MFKEYLVAAAKNRDLRVKFQDYLINQHAEAVLKLPVFQSIFKRYIINRVLPATSMTSPLLFEFGPDVAAIVEHSCDRAEQFRNAMQDEEYIRSIRPDERYMVDEFQVSLPFVVEVSETVCFFTPDAGQYCIFDFLKRRPDVTEAAFSTWLEQEGDFWAGQEKYREAVTGRVHNDVSNAQAAYAVSGVTSSSTGRIFDGIIETCMRSPEAIDPFLEQMRLRHREYVDPSFSFSVATRRHILIN